MQLSARLSKLEQRIGDGVHGPARFIVIKSEGAAPSAIDAFLAADHIRYSQVRDQLIQINVFGASTGRIELLSINPAR